VHGAAAACLLSALLAAMADVVAPRSRSGAGNMCSPVESSCVNVWRATACMCMHTRAIVALCGPAIE
jgi:hypothetical protein